MGHYDEQYEAMEEASERRRAEERAWRKKRFPKDRSQWGLSLEERVKLLEDELFKPNVRRGSPYDLNNVPKMKRR